MEYSIKAIPTVYGGVRFRSRLEARWAAFFDLCKWEWEYEPCFKDGWLPDFALKMRDDNSSPSYCEVKPICMTASSADLKTIFKKALRSGAVLLGNEPLTARECKEDKKYVFDTSGTRLAIGLYVRPVDSKIRLAVPGLQSAPITDADEITMAWDEAHRRIMPWKWRAV